MECLAKLIGANNVCNPDEGNIHIINDLEGITIDTSNKSVNGETASGYQLISKSIELASKHLLNDIRTMLSDRVRHKPVASQLIVGKYQDNRKVKEAIGNFGGYSYDICDTTFLRVRITSVSIFLPETKTVTINVWNLVTGEIIHTFAIDAIANRIITKEVDLLIETKGQRLNFFVGHDLTNSETYDTRIRSSCWACEDYVCDWATVRQAKIGTGDPIQENSLNSLGHGAGLSVKFNIECSLESYVCRMKEIFAWAMLHKTGEYIMRAYLYSKRKNSDVIVHAADHKELMQYFQNVYMQSMRQISETLYVPKDVCFNCTTTVKRLISVP